MTEAPDAIHIKYTLYGIRQEHVEKDPPARCSHGKEEVNGRWGCLECYVKLRREEDLWYDQNKDRHAQLKDILEHNKHCWERLGDYSSGGHEDLVQYFARWAKIRRDFRYKGDWVQYVRFRPTIPEVKGFDHYHDGVEGPCPQGRKINGTFLCKQHWEQNIEDITDLSNIYNEQRREECLRLNSEAEAMMGGFAANCDWEHRNTTFNELAVEFDHAFPPPEAEFDSWKSTPEEKANPKEKSSNRLL